MLTIINNLKPFFEDCYRRIHVREYARIMRVTPPTASKLLNGMYKKGLLKKEVEKQYLLYYANKDSELFIDLSRIYWKYKLSYSGLLNFIEQQYLSPVVILFGSLSKAEVKKDSDIDLAIFTLTKKEIDLSRYEKKLKRKIQMFVFRSIDAVKNKELLNNILNGYKIMGVF